ncbi:cellulase family glycosylhydrolase [Fontimonas sp. SYSU GA230001]|uniref:cellulase family glycosylhydrolase n=1 Tax=Fontimonas sp. SYSU GA230001 TaxID=3142450 RepID=UPI0032B5EEDF
MILRAGWVAGLALALTALSGCGNGGPDGGGAAVPQQLRRDGRWLVDGHNRVVITHGVNVVWKTAPYVPPDAAKGFRAADADWLADHGFNSARIGTLWVGVSPHAPGVIDTDYLAQWDRIVQLLASRRIWILFDFHQDMLGPVYQGEGVPDWAVEPVEGLFTTLLGPPSFGFPFNYFTPQVSEAFDNLWAERGPVWDGFRDAWIAVARRWKDQPYSMGYDLLNEPWAGMEYMQCLQPWLGCESHERDELQPFYTHALTGIRSVDPDNLVWFEPQPLISTGAPARGYEAIPGESQLGYSFHYYCPLNTLANAAQLGVLDTLPFGPQDTCESFGDTTFAEARAQGEKMQAVELLTEFGATDELPVLAEVARQADENLVGWQYWQYKNFDDPTTESQDSGAQSLFADDADLSTAKLDKLKILSRTYPQATAGVPLALSFDPDTAEFQYRYTPRAATAPTEIFVPVALHYPNGYQVEVSGATLRSAANAPRLLLDNLTGATEVSVRVTRRP